MTRPLTDEDFEHFAEMLIDVARRICDLPETHPDIQSDESIARALKLAAAKLDPSPN